MRARRLKTSGNNLRLDIHVHTSPGSRCSELSVCSYLQAAARLELDVICLTNHGEIADFEEMVSRAADDLTIIAGVEISSKVGDFLVFSKDLDFLRTLAAEQPLPGRIERPAHTAVVWAHPFAGNVGGLDAAERYIRDMAAEVDGIEVYNGNWPDNNVSALAHRIASEYGLAELGGSDAHRQENLMRCWTEFETEIKNAADLIAAILKRNTVAAKL